jgi:hypothetical protein
LVDGRVNIPHLGRFYPSTPDTARRHVRGFTIDDYARLKADDGAPVLTGLQYRMLAKAYKAPLYKLFIGTPYQGEGVQPDYVASIYKLQRVLGIDVRHEMDLIAAGYAFEEVVVVHASDGFSWWDWKVSTNEILYAQFRRPRCWMLVQIFAQPDGKATRFEVEYFPTENLN